MDATALRFSERASGSADNVHLIIVHSLGLELLYLVEKIFIPRAVHKPDIAMFGGPSPRLRTNRFVARQFLPIEIVTSEQATIYVYERLARCATFFFHSDDDAGAVGGGGLLDQCLYIRGRDSCPSHVNDVPYAVVECDQGAARPVRIVRWFFGKGSGQVPKTTACCFTRPVVHDGEPLAAKHDTSKVREFGIEFLPGECG